jgi:hypothetical protein
VGERSEAPDELGPRRGVALAGQAREQCLLLVAAGAAVPVGSVNSTTLRGGGSARRVPAEGPAPARARA